MTTTEQFLADTPVDRPEPKRDRWGRPLIPHPETGKVQPWTRATTMAKTVADLHGLTKWQLRMVAQGLVARPDYYAGVAAANGDKRKLDRICDEAKEAAASSARANLGSALHVFTERIDAGEDVAVPDPWATDVHAYCTTMSDSNIRVHSQWIERLTVIPELDVAGTFDRIVTMPDGRLLIADLKTGQNLDYSWGEIGIQLALYSRGVGLWDGGTGYDPMPPVDQHEALVMHLPVGEAKCTLHLVDLDVGWQMAELCGQVRDWRKRKDLHRPLSHSAPAKLDPDKTRTNWIRSRMRALKPDDRARIMVAQMWPEVVPTRPPWSDDQIDMLHRVLTHVETIVDTPWPEPDPARTPPGIDRFHQATQ